MVVVNFDTWKTCVMFIDFKKMLKGTRGGYSSYGSHKTMFLKYTACVAVT